jgi:hypothetical protein
MTNDAPVREPDKIRQDCAHKLRQVQVSEYFQVARALGSGPDGGDWTVRTCAAKTYDP